jgi:cytidylate kinase
MPIVTISRLYAAGGATIAGMVARALGVECLDRRLLVEAARQLGATVEAVAARDERTSTLRERIQRAIGAILERSAVSASPGFPDEGYVTPAQMEYLFSRTAQEAARQPITSAQEIDDRRYLEVIKRVITEAAESGEVVILGHGSQIILWDHPHAFHVFVVAPLEIRVERVMQAEGLDREATLKRMKEIDSARDAWHRKFFRVDRNDPSLYHLAVNTGRIPFEMAATLIANSIQMLEVAHP